MTLPNKVDDDRSHDLCRIGHKTRTLGRVDAARLENAQKRFMDQRRGIEQSDGLVPLESGVRKTAEIVVQVRKKLLGCLVFATFHQITAPRSPLITLAKS